MGTSKSRKRPIQRLQRARSRVYSKIYPREKYERPYSKDEFLARFSAVGSSNPPTHPVSNPIKPLRADGGGE
jgi:hypothetical protein